jgi:hypothetical protein
VLVIGQAGDAFDRLTILCKKASNGFYDLGPCAFFSFLGSSHRPFAYEPFANVSSRNNKGNFRHLCRTYLSPSSTCDQYLH